MSAEDGTAARRGEVLTGSARPASCSWGIGRADLPDMAERDVANLGLLGYPVPQTVDIMVRDAMGFSRQ